MTVPPEFPPPTPYPAYPQTQEGQPPAPYGQSPWQQPTHSTPPPSGTNGFAIASLVFGIIGGCLLGFIFGIVALVQTGKTGQKGRAMAIAGLVLSGLWVVGLIVVGVVSSTTEADRDSTGTVTDSGNVTVDDLKVGDCINGIEAGKSFSDLPAVRCAEPHSGEVYALVEIAGSDYPGSDVLIARADRLCARSLRETSMKSWKDPGVTIFHLRPTDYSWTRGDHAVTCVAVTEKGKRTGSIRD